MAQEHLTCSSRPMEARLSALESRLRQTVVVERLARQTDEVAQQTVGTRPAGVDAEEI